MKWKLSKVVAGCLITCLIDGEIVWCVFMAVDVTLSSTFNTRFLISISNANSTNFPTTRHQTFDERVIAFRSANTRHFNFIAKFCCCALYGVFVEIDCAHTIWQCGTLSTSNMSDIFENQFAQEKFVTSPREESSETAASRFVVICFCSPLLGTSGAKKCVLNV